MQAHPDAAAAPADGTPSLPETLVAVRLELSHTEAAQLRALGGSAWVRGQLAAAEGGPADARPDLAGDYLVGLAEALFPLPVSGDAVRQVDALRKQGMLEAAVTYDDGAGGDRAIVVDITSLGRAEIERRRRITLAG